MTGDPLLIGVTGGIGAGKSVICKIFQSLGVPLYNADDRARWLMANNSSLIADIKNQFGTDTYLENNKVNRTFLASVVFSDEEKLRQLNALVHPKVGEDFTRWVNENRGPLYVIKEAALLFESGSYKQLDKIVNVDAPAALRKARVLLRDPHRNATDIDAILARQFRDHERRERADYNVINNEHKLVIPQVLKLHTQFLDLAAERTA